MKLTSKPTQHDISPRINRQTFIFSWLMMPLPLVGFFMLRFIVNNRYDFVPWYVAYLLAAVGILSGAILVLGWVIIAVYRLHDTKWSPWWAFLMVESPANLVLSVLLALEPGKKGRTRFGPQPKGLQYRKVFRIEKQ